MPKEYLHKDLFLIKNIQDHNCKKSINKVFCNFRNLINKYSGALYKKIRNKDYCIEYEDIVQDYSLQLMETIKRVDINKVKQKNRFSLWLIVDQRFRAYTPVIKNKYIKSYMFHYQQVDKKNLLDSIHNKKWLEEFLTKISYDPTEMYEERLFLDEFNNSLTENEIIILERLIEGYPYYMIGENLSISPATITNIKRGIEKKFDKFSCDL